MLYFVIARSESVSDSKLTSFIARAVTPEKTIRYFRESVDICSMVGDQWSYSSDPQVILVEFELYERNPEILKHFRKEFKQALVLVESADQSLEFLQNCLAAGATNVFSSAEGEDALLRKIVLGLEQVRPQRKAALVVVDGSKGGTGVTTLVASLGAVISDAGSNVLLMDMDYESQDLSRYLAIRPFLNEQLELLFSGGMRAGIESVSKSCSLVWSDKSLSVAGPAARYENLLKGELASWNKLKTFLEIASSLYDVIIIDTASLPRYVVLKLLELADSIVCLVGLSPTAVHAALARLRGMLAGREDFFKLHLVPVQSSCSVSAKDLQNEFAKHIVLENATWSTQILPYDRRLQLWPGSVHSPVQYCGPKFKRAVRQLATELELPSSLEVQQASELLARFKVPLGCLRNLNSILKPTISQSAATDAECKLLPPGRTLSRELITGVKFLSSESNLLCETSKP